MRTIALVLVTVALVWVGTACGPRSTPVRPYPVPPSTRPQADEPEDLLRERGYDVAVPALLKASDDADPRVRRAALRVLWEIGAKDDTVVDLLLRALKDEDPRQRLLAARFVREFGPRAKSAVPVMRAELAGASGWLRVALAEALWSIGRDADAAVPALLAEMAGADAASKPTAAKVLKGIGPAAVPVLRRVLRDDNAAVRKAAAAALDTIEAEERKP